MSRIDIPALKATAPLSAIAPRYVKLVRAGREWKACCPFHADKTPSFTVYDDGRGHCYGCGWDGDVLDFVSAIENVGLRRAAEIIGQVHAAGPAPVRRTEPPEDRETEKLAASIWADAAPIAGTPAETYLRSRGIICRLPETLRFARLQYGKRGPQHPCMVAVVTDLNDELTGIQRTYLNAAGTGKATVPKAKLSLGRIRGGAIRLAPHAAEIILCEGLEDALTLQQELGTAAWAAAGIDNLRFLQLPRAVRSVIIGADRDEPGEAGARAAAERFAAQGRRARIIRPMPGFKDFNDELREVAR